MPITTKTKSKSISQTDYEKGYQAALNGKTERDNPYYPQKFDNSFSIGRNRHNSWLKGFNAGLIVNDGKLTSRTPKLYL